MKSLVTTDWLAAHLDDHSLVVFDATKHLPGAGRDADEEYAKRHIPGALYLDLGTLVDAASDVPAAVPTAAQLQERLRSLGIHGGEHIVLYDDSAIRTSARAWFILRLHGLTDVAILDGGLQKWMEEDRPLSADATVPGGGQIDIPEPASRVRTKADMLGNITSGAAQVVDARDAARFAGTGGEGGHIPGSRNLPFTKLFQKDGTYRDPGELRAVFADAGMTLDRPVTATCGSGMTASVLLFALHLVGNDAAALYDGSWTEWGNDPALPVQTGPAD